MIALNNHHCHAAARRTVELHRRNINRFVRQHRRHIRHMSRLIVVVYNQGWITAGKIGFNPIDLRNIDPGTAQGFTYYRQTATGNALKLQFRRIWMRLF